MKRYFSIGAVSLLVVAALVVLFGPAVVGTRPMVDGMELGGGSATQIIDGYASIFILHGDPGQVSLVDCGNDPKGEAILQALKLRGLGPEAVKAIFLTHGHWDHTAGCQLFAQAEVYAFAGDVKLAAGEERGKGPLPRFLTMPRDKVARVTRTLDDGSTIAIGSLQVRAFSVPGHTAGSAAYLSNGVLFLGDNAGALRNGKVRAATWVFTDNAAQNLAELRKLYARLRAEGAVVRTLAFGHTGPFEGLEGLLTIED